MSLGARLDSVYLVYGLFHVYTFGECHISGRKGYLYLALGVLPGRILELPNPALCYPLCIFPFPEPLSLSF